MAGRGTTNNNSILPKAYAQTSTTETIQQPQQRQYSTYNQQPSNQLMSTANNNNNIPYSSTNNAAPVNTTSSSDSGFTPVPLNAKSVKIPLHATINIKDLPMLPLQNKLQPGIIPFHPRDLKSYLEAKKRANAGLGPTSNAPVIHLSPRLLKTVKPNNTSSILPPSSQSSLTNKGVNTTTFTESPKIQSIMSGPGFDGLSKGPTARCCSPPDVQIAVGPNYIVEMVNSRGETFTKLGTAVGMPYSLSGFFDTGDDLVSDPEILYDSGSGRFFAILLDRTADNVTLAVSGSEDPTHFNLYRFHFDDCPDQPAIGVSDDKVAISGNNFSDHCGGGASFQGVQYYIIRKSDLINGSPTVDSLKVGQDRSLFSLVPVHNLTPSSTLYMATNQDPFLSSSSIIKLYYIEGSLDSGVTSRSHDFRVSRSTHPPDARQPGTSCFFLGIFCSRLIDTGDDRLHSGGIPVFSNGRIWIASTTGCGFFPPVLSCARFVELDPNAQTKLQDFVLGDDGTFFFYPSLTVDDDSNVDFIIGYSSKTDYPSLVVGTLFGGSASLLETSILKQGSADSIEGRYGDYFGAASDPSCPGLAWVAGEYVSSNRVGWSTFVSGISPFTDPCGVQPNVNSLPLSTYPYSSSTNP